MANEKLAELLKTQKSLTEWLEDIKHKDAEAIRKEDNEKRERLKILEDIIGLPFDKPTQFEAIDLTEKNPKFIKYLKEHGDEACAIRLIPKKEGLPKLRIRGKPVSGAYGWFLEQEIKPTDYRVDFIPHADATWSLIFVINKHGIQGEIIRGLHTQLTQGFHERFKPLVFRYDFQKWQLSGKDPESLTYLKRLVKFLKVSDKKRQAQLKKKLSSTFADDYLEGYFEAYESDEFGTWFIDYSPVLGKMYADMLVKMPSATKALVQGQIGCLGKAKGPAQIVDPKNIDKDFPKGAVLVCSVTTPDYVPLMQKAVAIVTDQGGILSHAAIVARELKKPCIVGTGNATKVLKNGQNVSVNADLGIVEQFI